MNVPKIRFNEFTDNYLTIKIGDVLKIKSGRDQKQVEDDAGIYPILGTGGKIGSTNSFLYDKPSVLIGRKGTINKPQYMDTPFWTVDTLFYSEIYEPNIPKYLYYLFQSINWSKYDESTGVPSLSCKTIESVSASIPNNNEQKKVSDFLTLLDKKIELQSKKIEALKLYKKGLVNKVFENNNIEKIVPLKSIGNSYTGLSGKTKDDFDVGNELFIPFISVLNNNVDLSNFRKVNVIDKTKQNKVYQKDLFFTVSSETAEEVGMCSTINKSFDNLYLNSFCFGFRLNNLCEVDNNYLCELLLSKKYRKIITNLGQGFTRVNISKNQILDIEVELPSIEDQNKISYFISIIKNKISLEENKLLELQELKKGLMKNMFV